MDKPKPCGPPPLEATYADLSTVIAAIQEHAKGNGYALFKRDTKPSRIITWYTLARLLIHKLNTIAKN